jgi:hypothetical protein
VYAPQSRVEFYFADIFFFLSCFVILIARDDADAAAASFDGGEHVLVGIVMPYITYCCFSSLSFLFFS